ncbi:ATPases associated with a variety of cellular activities [Vibrio sp. B1REV9]|uniref:ATP-binding cassette domain-containing protein n=1 Tax=Vibrio sp. B1REV9 TaxID=2751179 RepID=UPI001AF13EE4|nr:ATP-binding cassette domain-containing protein [Vibrio sp. B1REV9]CAE6922373.1 ATPases associated with a variety of cellular activities [Vibrio sp. B1REV9]
MLSINNISIYDTKTNTQILDSVTLDIKQHEMVAIVGGSGGGKTVLANMILNNLPKTLCASGNIKWEQPQGLDNQHNKKAALISQHASSLNPNLTIGSQLKLFTQGSIQLHQLLRLLGLSSHILSAYPYQLSGGIVKRVLTCMALVQRSYLVVADEPTCGLDEANAVQLMTLYKSWSKLASSFLIISHDLPLVCQFVDRVFVMNNGAIVEQTTPSRIIKGHCHSYTQALWQSQPRHWHRQEFSHRSGV